MTAAYRTDLFLAWMGGFVILLKSAFRADAYINRFRVAHISVTNGRAGVFNFITATERASDNRWILVRLIEETATVVAFMPVAVEIYLSALNDYLFAVDKGISDLRPCLGINTRECRAWYIHNMSSLMMAHVFEITKPDDFILLKMQEYRLGLTFLCNTTIRS